MNIRNIVSQFLDDDSIEQFCTWAFGENYIYLYGGQAFADSWNKIHGDKFQLGETGNILSDFDNMIKMWKNEEKEPEGEELKEYISTLEANLGKSEEKIEYLEKELLKFKTIIRKFQKVCLDAAEV